MEEGGVILLCALYASKHSPAMSHVFAVLLHLKQSTLQCFGEATLKKSLRSHHQVTRYLQFVTWVSGKLLSVVMKWYEPKMFTLLTVKHISYYYFTFKILKNPY